MKEQVLFLLPSLGRADISLCPGRLGVDDIFFFFQVWPTESVR